ncbi:MAG: DUF4129 domain-containing protein [Cyanobacteria bacterium J06639_1]
MEPTANIQTSSWAWRVRTGQRWLSEWVELHTQGWNVPEVDLPEWSLPDGLGRVLFWLLVAIASVAIGLYLARALPRWWSLLQPWRRAGVNRTTQVGEVSSTPESWVRRALQMQPQGQYGEACRALYMALLQHWNDVQAIPFDSSRTDGEYLQLVDRLLLPREACRTLISTHERLSFAGAIASANDYQLCYTAYQLATASEDADNPNPAVPPAGDIS